jgi:predicted nucleotidyltransferase component of viral defense system
MLNLEDILKTYPQRLHGFKENILKEYLQCRILDILYGARFADRLVFMGGTAIRIVHQGMRFSEDLDFDNRGLDENDFNDLANLIQRELTLDGYTVVIKNVFKGAYHCHVIFPGLLFEQGMSGHKEERIFIQVDAEPQRYSYEPGKFLINSFGIFRYINTVPPALLLSQKILACLKRKRGKGRDFFDVVFLK